MKSRGRRFRHDTPLFVKERGTTGLTTNLVQNMMRTVALKSGLIDEENNGKALNPLGPHALRESFGSIMINSGVPDTIVDFWLGHTIGEMAEAYKGVQFESLKQIYLEREKLISIVSSKVDVKEIEAKLRVELDEGKKELAERLGRYINIYGEHSNGAATEQCYTAFGYVVSLLPEICEYNAKKLMRHIRERMTKSEEKLKNNIHAGK